MIRHDEAINNIQGESVMDKQERWYVRVLETGTVYGPVTKTRAEQRLAELMDGTSLNAVLFNEKIFEPQFVPSEEVEEVILHLRSVKQHADVPEFARGLLAPFCNRAAELLVLLSAKKSPAVLTAEVDGLITQLSKTATEALQELQSNGESSVPSYDDLLHHFCSLATRAAQFLVLLSAKKVVTGSIKGGVLDLDELPPGVEVDIRDYDADGGGRRGIGRG